MTNLATSRTMQRALAEAFGDHPAIHHAEQLRDGYQPEPDNQDWHDGLAEYEVRLGGGREAQA
jgi:hypothetical protein